MNDLVDEIAKKKAELTKGHLQCVVEGQNILTKEAENEGWRDYWEQVNH